ncbi:MAG TPA: tail-specific protease, partial [Methylophilaceae bacterium]|nr:tail-specific protease [Methylophilaceae bacterium]
MKNRFLWLLLAIALSAQAATPNTATPSAQLKPLPEHAQAAHMAAEVLTRYHYRHIPLDDKSSSKIFDNYLKALDEEKLFFTQSDIDRFSIARTWLDDAIFNENLSAPFAIHNAFQQRA